MATKTEKQADKWQQRFRNRQNKLRPMFDNALKYFDILYAVQNTDKISPWKSKVYLPVLASKAWDLIARMSDIVPLYNVTIKNELDLDDGTGNFQIPQDVRQREERIQAKLHYDYTCGHEEPMKLKVFDPLVDAVAAGTGYAYAPWIVETKKQQGRKFDDTGVMDNKKVVTKKTTSGHNGFEGVNFFNVFPADAPSFFKTPYLIIRGVKPLSDMKASGLYDPAALSSARKKVDLNEFQLYNEARNRVVNEGDVTWVDDTVDMVTYYECYERTPKGIELTTYAEGESEQGKDGNWVELRPTFVPFWHDMYPVVPFYSRKKSYSVFGESLFENNRTLQSATNDILNHYIDNLNVSLESMLMYEDGSLTNDFIIEPGGEITFTGEAPKQFKFPEPNPQQLTLVMDVLEKGVDAATFSPYATGSPNDSSDKTQGTAYGVKSITEAATTKIGFFRDNFKQSMKILGQIWLSHLQQFSDDPSEVRRVVSGRTVPDIILPSDYQGEVEVDIDDDSMVPLSKQDKRDMNDQFINNILNLQKAAVTQAEVFKVPADIPRFNFHELLEDAATLYSVKDVERYLLDSQVEIPQPGGPDVREFLNMSYKDTPPDVQAQIEELYHFKPSSMHNSNLTHQAIQMGAEQAQIENGDPNGQRLNAANQPADQAGQPNSQPGAAA